MISTAKRFILIDDDPINNLFSLMVLKKALGDIEVLVFNQPELGLEYIENELCFKNFAGNTIIFLDINMPTMTGWEFLQKFKAFALPLQRKFVIYMLSSSIDPVDIERTKLNHLVADFIEKPLKKLTILKMFG